MCGDAARDDVEARVGERELLGAADNRRLPAWGRVDRDDFETSPAQHPGDMASPGSDVEPGRALRPFGEELQVAPLAVRVALTISLGPFRPDIGHAASSTARLAASSIV